MNFKSPYYLSLIMLCVLLSSCSKKGPWSPLFNGKNLDNFEVLNGTATYSVENKCIIGVSKTSSPNTFLSTKEKYGDFILEFEVWVDTLLNSGVQFRSICDPNIKDGIMHGYQVEIESSPRKWAGGIYDEARRGWIYDLENNPNGRAAFKPNQWNKYRVEAIGYDLRTWVNGIQCANLIDDETAEGIIGFQVHSIADPKKSGKQIKWRNIKILTEDFRKHRWPIESYAPVINLVRKTI